MSASLRQAAAVASATLLLLAAGLALGGYDAGAALAALWRGSFGSWYVFTSATLVRATPLIVIALGFALAFRGGALNIGAEGQFYAGATAAAWTGLHTGSVPGPVAIALVWAAALLGGLLWIAVPVLLRLRYGVLEVISTLLLNFVAESAVSLMVLGPMQEASRIYPQSDPIAESARLPLLPGTRLHLGILIALLLAGALWFIFARTLWGFRLLAAGLGPKAAVVSGGVNVRRATAVALLASGAIAGLAGGIEVSGVSYALYPNLSPGYGFTAIAVALLARLQPPAIVLSGIFFGALEAGAGAMQREAGVSAVVVYVVEATVIIGLLLADARARRAAIAPAGSAAAA